MKKIITLIIVAAITMMTATTAFAQTAPKELAASAVEVKGLEKVFPELTPVFEQVVVAINQCIAAITTPVTASTSTPATASTAVPATAAVAPLPPQTIVEVKTAEAAAYTQLTADIIEASLKQTPTATPASANPDVNKYLAQAAYWTAEAYALLK